MKRKLWTPINFFLPLICSFCCQQNLSASDSSAWFNLDPTIDHLQLTEPYINYSNESYQSSLQDVINGEFIPNSLWNILHPDVNEYSAWVKIKFVNTSPYVLERFLRLPGNHITTYAYKDGNPVDTFITGNLLRKSDRAIETKFRVISLVPIVLNPGDSIVTFSQIYQSNFYPLNTRSFFVSSPISAQLHSSRFLKEYGVLHGILSASILILGLYFLAVFVFSRQWFSLIMGVNCFLEAVVFQTFHSVFYRLNISPTIELYGAISIINILPVLDLFFLALYLQHSLGVKEISKFLKRAAIILAFFTIGNIGYYYFVHNFFTTVMSIAMIHGIIHLARICLGIWLFSNKTYFTTLLGLAIIIGQVFFLIASYYSLANKFDGNLYLEIGTCIYALGIVFSFSYQASESRKELELAERNSVISAIKLEASERLYALQERFFVNVTHELRTPLALITGPLRTILERPVLKGIEKKILRTAERNASDLILKVNSLLDLSKLDSRSLRVNMNPLYVYPEISKWINDYEETAKDNIIELIFDYQSERDRCIMMDREKFESIIKNLITNALKSMPDGGILTIGVHLNNDDIFISVRDTGIGIPPDDIELIFDRYFQSDAPGNKDMGGTGIGLAICKEYVTLLDGEINVESELGKGSNFSVRLPFQAVTGAQLLPQMSSSETATVGMTTQDIAKRNANKASDRQLSIGLPNLLIVEDNYQFRQYLSLIIQGHYNILTSRHGKEALGLLGTFHSSESNHSIDLIITDLMMPVMNGYEFINQIKQDQNLQDIPIIVLTARSDWGSKKSILRLGVDSYLVKPFESQELLTTIEVLLSRQSVRLKSIDPVVANINNGQNESVDNKAWLSQFENFVSENISSPHLTQELIANELYLSKRQLHRRIKSMVGITPNQFIKEIRLERARSLLLSHKCHSVKEVSLLVGFKKTSYFTKIFHSRYGKVASSYL